MLHIFLQLINYFTFTNYILVAFSKYGYINLLQLVTSSQKKVKSITVKLCTEKFKSRYAFLFYLISFIL